MNIDAEALAAFDAEKVGEYRREECAVFRKTAEKPRVAQRTLGTHPKPPVPKTIATPEEPGLCKG